MARGLIALAFLVVACAQPGPEVLETGSVESALPDVIWPQDPGLVTLVECPNPIEDQVAQEIRCTAVLDTDQVTIDVVVDEVGLVTATVRQPLFDVAAIREQLAARLAADLGLDPPAVDCVRAVVVARAGTEFGCTATRGADPIEFTVRLLDASGGWTVDVALS